MSGEVSGNKVYEKVLDESRESLRRGASLSLPLAQSWVFPSLVSHMVAIGEETGQLDTMLEKIADFYEEEVEQLASRLSTVIEPLMIAILGSHCRDDCTRGHDANVLNLSERITFRKKISKNCTTLLYIEGLF